MPIEIKELHIKVNVEEDANRTGEVQGQLSAEKEEQLIARCIKQVMQLLKDKKEP